jgi:hypothetical protein
MEIIKQITAKNKAYDIIYSCETIPQCNTAENYVGRYLTLFEDRLGFNDLMRLLKEHKVGLLKPSKN